MARVRRSYVRAPSHRTSVALGQDLCAAIDVLADELGTSRSAMIVALLGVGLERYKNLPCTLRPHLPRPLPPATQR
jgi:hypothetical protein